MIRVLLADDQALVRGALASLLRMESDVDVQMPGRDGLAVTAELRHALPDCRVLICTTFSRPGYLSRAMSAGAAGFVVKDSRPEQLINAIRRVHAGLRFVDPALAAESLASGASPLTDREADVLRAGGQGRRDERVAVALRTWPQRSQQRRRGHRLGGSAFTGLVFDGGHDLAEEVPDALLPFLAKRR